MPTSNNVFLAFFNEATSPSNIGLDTYVGTTNNAAFTVFPPSGSGFATSDFSVQYNTSASDVRSVGAIVHTAGGAADYKLACSGATAGSLGVNFDVYFIVQTLSTVNSVCTAGFWCDEVNSGTVGAESLKVDLYQDTTNWFIRAVVITAAGGTQTFTHDTGLPITLAGISIPIRVVVSEDGHRLQVWADPGPAGIAIDQTTAYQLPTANYYGIAQHNFALGDIAVGPTFEALPLASAAALPFNDTYSSGSSLVARVSDSGHGYNAGGSQVNQALPDLLLDRFQVTAGSLTALNGGAAEAGLQLTFPADTEINWDFYLDISTPASTSWIWELDLEQDYFSTVYGPWGVYGQSDGTNVSFTIFDEGTDTGTATIPVGSYPSGIQQFTFNISSDRKTAILKMGGTTLLTVTRADTPPQLKFAAFYLSDDATTPFMSVDRMAISAVGVASTVTAVGSAAGSSTASGNAPFGAGSSSGTSTALAIAANVGSSQGVASVSGVAYPQPYPDGTLWAHGTQSNGNLGFDATRDGTVINNEQIGTDSDWAEAVFAGGGTILLARKRNGTIWVCGKNFHGSLGLGNPTTTFVQYGLTQIGTDTDWVRVFTGWPNISNDSRAFALKANGDLYLWGSDLRNNTVNPDILSPTLYASGMAGLQTIAYSSCEYVFNIALGTTRTFKLHTGWGATGITQFPFTGLAYGNTTYDSGPTTFTPVGVSGVDYFFSEGSQWFAKTNGGAIWSDGDVGPTGGTEHFEQYASAVRSIPFTEASNLYYSKNDGSLWETVSNLPSSPTWASAPPVQISLGTEKIETQGFGNGNFPNLALSNNGHLWSITNPRVVAPTMLSTGGRRFVQTSAYNSSTFVGISGLWSDVDSTSDGLAQGTSTALAYAPIAPGSSVGSSTVSGVGAAILATRVINEIDITSVYQIARALTISWNINGRLINSQSVTWDSLTTVRASTDIRWADRVIGSQGVTYASVNQVINSAQISYSLYTRIQAAQSIAWNITNTNYVIQTFDVTYVQVNTVSPLVVTVDDSVHQVIILI